jgi:hypothetical protein
VRKGNEADATWQTREHGFASVKMSYDLDKAKWVTANNMIKNTIEPAFVGSIPNDDMVLKCLKRIKRQFTGSSMTYATQLIKQLFTEKYTGDGIREHILKMNNQISKLKPMNLVLKESSLFILFSLPCQRNMTFLLLITTCNQKNKT